MFIESLASEDLPQVSSIQPEGWQPIVPVFQFYLQSPFCFPIKVLMDDQLVGIGATILHHQTAWLAHIIVTPTFRNKGIGAQITKALIQIAEKYYCKTILLLASELGEPVYVKLGFKKETDYIFFQGGKVEQSPTENSIPFERQYRNHVLKFDRLISGEDRSKLLEPHLTRSRVTIQNNKLIGLYMPTLGEGLVIAENSNAGISLLKERLSPEKNRIALPSENKAAIDFLISCGYTESLRGSRMYLGNPLHWKPSKIFSRTGGNLG